MATPGANAISYQNSGLNASTTYYYRILSYNSGGSSAWSNVASAKTNNNLPFTNKTLSFVPALDLLLDDDKTPVNTVVSSTGQVWMDRNLGASRVATSSKDSEAWGDLYQWGRGTDGHEKRDSGTTLTKTTTDTPGHSLFIISSNSPCDWRTPQNDNLWQGVSGANNPCPTGFRLPTMTELETERVSWSSNDAAGAYGSPLKFVGGGSRDNGGGTILGVGNFGFYWSGTVDGIYSRYLGFGSGLAEMSRTHRAYGFTVRCIKD